MARFCHSGSQLCTFKDYWKYSTYILFRFNNLKFFFLLFILLVAPLLSHFASSLFPFLPEDFPSLQEETFLINSLPATKLHRNFFLDLRWEISVYQCENPWFIYSQKHLFPSRNKSWPFWNLNQGYALHIYIPSKPKNYFM